MSSRDQREAAAVAAALEKWRRIVQPLKDAVRESEVITEDDLRIIVSEREAVALQEALALHRTIHCFRVSSQFASSTWEDEMITLIRRRREGA